MPRILIYGAPASGKSTRGEYLSKSLNIPLMYREQYPTDRDFITAVKEVVGDVIVIRCCFSNQELRDWKRFSRATQTICVQPPLKQVKLQALNRGTPEQYAAIDRWFAGHRKR